MFLPDKGLKLINKMYIKSVIETVQCLHFITKYIRLTITVHSHPHDILKYSAVSISPHAHVTSKHQSSVQPAIHAESILCMSKWNLHARPFYEWDDTDADPHAQDSLFILQSQSFRGVCDRESERVCVYVWICCIRSDILSDCLWSAG